MSNIHADNVVKDIEKCNDMLHALKKSISHCLAQKTKEASSMPKEENFDAAPIARRLVQSFLFEVQQVGSLLAPSMIDKGEFALNHFSMLASRSAVGGDSKPGVECALMQNKHSNRKLSRSKEGNEGYFE